MNRLRWNRRAKARNAILTTLALSGHDTWWTSLNLMAATRLGSGRYYPTIMGLEREGLIEGRWQSADERGDRLHPRRLYRIGS